MENDAPPSPAAGTYSSPIQLALYPLSKGRHGKGLIAYPTLNARWLITGQGEMWDGPPPKGLKDIQPPSSAAPNQELFNQLLVQKLQEVARELKMRDPEAYRKLGLEELVDKAGGEV